MSLLNVTFKPKYEIPFSGTIAATTQGGQASNRIDIPFRVNGMIAIFGNNHLDNVRYHFLTADTPAISTTSMSNGSNIIKAQGVIGYFVGHNTVRPITVIREYLTGGVYLKLHVNNLNAYQITYNASIIIEEI